MHGRTYRIALGGVLTALAVSVMFLGGVIPLATYISPAIASIAVLYFAVEYGTKYALGIYVSIAVIVLLLSPDKEQALLFACFLGWYPAVKFPLELRFKGLALPVIKASICSACIAGLYYIITKVFVLDAVREEFSQYSTVIVVVLAILGLFTFMVFDVALTRLVFLWRTVWRSKFIK
jgi:hypothetical protein